jgi:hypothetical protein
MHRINMSYCKYYNTLAALRQCVDDEFFYDHLQEDQMSDEEFAAKKTLFGLIKELAAEIESIPEFDSWNP